jgi:hypothetical protein
VQDEVVSSNDGAQQVESSLVWDCDQVRRKIRAFIGAKAMTTAAFLTAIGRVSSGSYSRFMKQRGVKVGANNGTYRGAHGFFAEREGPEAEKTAHVADAPLGSRSPSRQPAIVRKRARDAPTDRPPLSKSRRVQDDGAAPSNGGAQQAETDAPAAPARRERARPARESAARTAAAAAHVADAPLGSRSSSRQPQQPGQIVRTGRLNLAHYNGFKRDVPVQAMFVVEQKEVWFAGAISKRENHGDCIKVMVNFEDGDTRWFTLPDDVDKQQLRHFKRPHRSPFVPLSERALCRHCVEGTGRVEGHKGPHTTKRKPGPVQRPNPGSLSPPPSVDPQSATVLVPSTVLATT